MEKAINISEMLIPIPNGCEYCGSQTFYGKNCVNCGGVTSYPEDLLKLVQIARLDLNIEGKMQSIYGGVYSNLMVRGRLNVIEEVTILGEVQIEGYGNILSGIHVLSWNYKNRFKIAGKLNVIEEIHTCDSWAELLEKTMENRFD